MNKITKTCTPTLPPSEVNELCRRYVSGDDEALDLLVSSHVAFVASIANRYASLGVPVEDLTSEGVLGLIEAAKRFDAERGNRFLTYAVFWIRRHILDALRRDSQPIRRPRKAATRAESNVAPRTKHPSRTVTVGEALNRTSAEAPLHFQSIDQANGSPSEPALSEMLEDTSAECPEDGLIRGDTRRVVWTAMDRLRPKHRLVVALRNGLCDDQRWTLRQVGVVLGVSRERVRQIEMQAVEELRRGVRRVEARPFRFQRVTDGPRRRLRRGVRVTRASRRGWPAHPSEAPAPATGRLAS